MSTLRPIALISVVFAAALPLWSDLIDRIAVSVGNRVVTTSDIDREIRVTAFFNSDKPDFSPANQRATADRLVEQKLVRKELETSSYPVPPASEVDPVLADFKKDRFPNEDGYQKALAEYGITDEDVRAEMLWVRTFLQFVRVRFRPAVQVTDAQIREYFDKVVAPAARASHPGEPVSFDDYREQIEEKLTGDLANAEMEDWLSRTRKRTDIVYHEEVFK